MIAGIAGNIKLVAMNGNQYWFSSSSPYAPNLNFHLAYQYCRTLGLQLVVLETKEEVDTISAYLNSFEGKRDGKKQIIIFVFLNRFSFLLFSNTCLLLYVFFMKIVYENNDHFQRKIITGVG